MMKAIALCMVLALCNVLASADYVSMEVTTNEYTDIADMLPTLLTKSYQGWNNVIKDTSDSITFTKSTNLKKFCDVDYTISSGTKISGLKVLVQFVETDSTSLATTEICAFAKQGNYYFPRIGLLTMDLSKAKELNARVLDNVMEHEIGHLLGIGTLWERYGLVKNGAYIGQGGVYGYERIGAAFGVESVPTQRSLTSSQYHWDDHVLGSELMTGRMNGKFHPLSSVTLNALTDLGYQVWPNRADAHDALDNNRGNDTTSVWIDLFHDYQSISVDQKVPIFADGTISYETVQFSSADAISSSSSESSHYHTYEQHPSTWEIVVTVLLVVVVLTLIGTCGVCLYHRRVQKFGNDPTEPVKFDDGAYPPVHQQQQNAHAMNAV
mmetsp:Transcript_5979/g.9628  ORF Transcript_5979/g.9628 Transcript_5979/m.9628 type:complete len:381 (+) Transcript_5979:172-1314(+)|eukprot:CAMPEP_0171500484 /NCGR_PEP_ID=MMETSP0958-20121227/9012_1 /TAXON_ID=87120 /ORGANISM="Aurantiochytrium limacinum, Strain ATCCMYA-1381" /LENGTH=380 /DNA_ID=CAMNT_0012035161 /DNA_START=63 /DNA_END=1205 /DNA_ORIENTATION=-